MYCLNCGKAVTLNTKFYANCGHEILVECPKETIPSTLGLIHPRNIFIFCLFSIFTCGVLNCIWCFLITKDIKKLIDDKKISTIPFLVMFSIYLAMYISLFSILFLSTSAAVTVAYLVVICMIIFLGCFILYLMYWNYRIGKDLFSVGTIYNVSISDNSILYMILTIFGFSIISLCLIQSKLNQIAVISSKGNN